MKRLILMLQFLTKLPLPVNIQADEKDFSKGVVYFPVVGLILGLLMTSVYLYTLRVFNPLIAAVMVVVFEIFITGGLHLDGLADTFDGLYSYRDKERMLEIMKDSRVGTNGVLVLIVSILLKVALIYSFRDPIYIIILMPIVSRCMVVFLSGISKYARNNGMGGFFIGKTTKLQMIIALIVTSLAHYFTPYLFIAFTGVIVFNIMFRWHVYHKIDGLTGDILGAAVELSEIIYLMIGLFVLGV